MAVKYTQMYRMLHTCDHILEYVLGKVCEGFEYTTLKIDDDEIRCYFKATKVPKSVTSEFLEESVREILSRNIPVKVYEIPRKEAVKMGLNVSLVTEGLDIVNIVEVEGISKQVCKGGHVNNTQEIAEAGQYKVLKFEKKGKDSYQVTSTIELKAKSEAKTAKLKPQTLKGFNDWFAEDMKLRQYVIEVFRNVFEKYGYEPLETPALEYSRLMLGQSGEEAEKLYYRFEDNGGRDVMLKFEVLAGMCRAVAQNLDKIPMPYKRYQIQRVWRAENVQRGRYREFTQCDADTIGSPSMICDGEFIQMGIEITRSLGFKEFTSRISNRKFLEGFALLIGVPERDFYGFCMTLDKLSKIGREKVIEEMVSLRGIDKNVAEKALDVLDFARYKDQRFEEIIDDIKKEVQNSKLALEGLEELRDISNYLISANVSEKNYCFDTSLARGFSYYTGPIWEFEIIEGNVGSIAGCGRYDKVISRYVGKEIPATGGSFGIERICDIIKDRKMIDLGSTTTEALVLLFEKDLWKESLAAADQLRKSGISTMLYPEAASLKKQFKYADRKGIPWAVVVGPDEVKEKKVQLKNMNSGKQESVSIEDAAKSIKKASS